MAIDIRRAGERFWTRVGWLDSRHSFSFGQHYDPANTHFGLLLVSNDDVVAPGTGFETHPHRDMEIVTWVLDGQLVHQDSGGHSGVIYPGLAQRMSAGTGILHSEKNDVRRLTGEAPGDEPVHFVQMWVVPDEPRISPGYEQLDITGELSRGGLVPVASGRGHDAAISIRQRDAALYAARLRPGESLSLPVAPYLHVYVAKGTVELEGAATLEGAGAIPGAGAVEGTGVLEGAGVFEAAGVLETGDAARMTAADGQKLVAGTPGAEVLVWEMHSTL